MTLPVPTAAARGALSPAPAVLPRLLQAALLAVLPAGGQRTARRNAWAGRSEDAARGRARREADLALVRAAARAARSPEVAVL